MNQHQSKKKKNFLPNCHYAYELKTCAVTVENTSQFFFVCAIWALEPHYCALVTILWRQISIFKFRVLIQHQRVQYTGSKGSYTNSEGWKCWNECKNYETTLISLHTPSVCIWAHCFLSTVHSLSNNLTAHSFSFSVLCHQNKVGQWITDRVKLKTAANC